MWTHLPLLMRTPSKKLSKRDADSFLDYYDRVQGYLPLAVINYLVRNGSGIRDYDPEKLYSLDDLVQRFDPTLLTKRDLLVGWSIRKRRNNLLIPNTSKIDQQRLDAYGRMAFCAADLESTLLPAIQQYLSHRSHSDSPSLPDRAHIHRVIDFLRQNEETFCRLSMLNDRFPYFFPSTSEEDHVAGILQQGFSREEAVEWLERLLSAYPLGWSPEPLKNMASGEGMNYRRLTALLRSSLIGADTGPPIVELVEFFTPEECTGKLRRCIEVLRSF